MKISIAAAIFILLVTALIGIPHHQRLSEQREKYAKLAADAAQLGLSVDPSRPDVLIRITKRERKDKEKDAKLVAAELIALAKEIQTIEKEDGESDETFQQRLMDFMDRMMLLDSSEQKILFAEVHSAKDLTDQTRQGLMGFSIISLASEHPQAALALFTESLDLFEKNIGEEVVSSSLAKWAKDDPMAALEWVKKNSAKFPDLINDDTKNSMISGAASHDPKLAFQLIGELGMQAHHSTIATIIDATRTPEERAATFAAYREHLATLSDESVKMAVMDSAISAFAHNSAKENFAAGTKWVAESNLTPAEIEGFSNSLTRSLDNNESGKWVEWIGEKLPPDKAANNIKSLIGKWTEKDYQAAGKWLNTVPAGPTKNTAISSYAETIAEYEPASATQWAMTLPPGKDRDQTLKNIYENWPKDDTAAKDAFQQEHGIK